MGSRFRSKWNKVFKEPQESDDSSSQRLQLSDDVTDFLKPSTEKAVARHAKLAPKIDIAIAQRFPESKVPDDSTADAPEIISQDGRAWVPLKPRRREGLAVGFARSTPEIIGEGGDDAADPPREISRVKAAMSRSRSDSRPTQAIEGRQWGASSQAQQQGAAGGPDSSGPGQEEDVVRRPLQRAQTSHNEFSPPLQKKQAQPLQHRAEPHGPSIGLKRAPTGFNNANAMDMLPLDTPTEKQVPLPKTALMLDSRLESESIPASMSLIHNSHPSQLLPGQGGERRISPVSKSPAYVASQARRRELRANEGAAFRRLSGMNFLDNDEGLESKLEGLNVAPQAASQRTVPATSSNAPSHDTDDTSNASPFDDPKYKARRTQENARPSSISVPKRGASGSAAMAPGQSTTSNDATGDQGGRYNTFAPTIQTDYSPVSGPATAGTTKVFSPDGESPRQPNFSRPNQSYHGPSEQQPKSAPALVYNTQIMANPSRPDQHSAFPDRLHQVDMQNGTPTAPYPVSTGLGPRLPQPSGPRYAHSRTNSTEDALARQSSTSSSASVQQYSSPLRQQQSHNQSQLDPRLLGRPEPSPYARNPSPSDYFSASRVSSGLPARSPAANLRLQDADRPGSAGSNRSFQSSMQRPMPSPLPTSGEGNQLAETALKDFSARVAHMAGVFRLTAEKEVPADRCTPMMWLRTAVWWFLRARLGLDELVRQKARAAREGQGGARELLTQAHVDLAKCWWILCDQFGLEESAEYESVPSPRSGDPSEPAAWKRAGITLRSHLQSVALTMDGKNLMPPHQSLIQGQDIRVWLEYPRFAPDAASILRGGGRSLISETATVNAHPFDFLPIADSRELFVYQRFPVEVFVHTDEAESDRVMLPCVVTMLRGRRDYQASLTIASQCDLVNVKIGPRSADGKCLTWHDVSWKASQNGMAVRLPKGFDLTVRFAGSDFRALWNFVEYTRKVEHGFRPEAHEKPVHEARLAEAQYMDSANANAFPQGNIRACRALLFEKNEQSGADGERRTMCRGFRFLLVTEAGHKMLSSVSQDLCSRAPLLFEYMTDTSNANGQVAMVIRIREQNRQVRILLVFTSADERQYFYDRLNGSNVEEDETIVTKVASSGLNIEPATQTSGFTDPSHPALQSLKWQKLGVTNWLPDDENGRIPQTIMSSSLRIVARHDHGCITDRVNLGKGELLIRLPCVAKPAIQILRQPQEDFVASIDARSSPPSTIDGIAELYRLARDHATIRTFVFQSMGDLFQFQAAITGFTVKFDGIASTFGIARRRMVVPIYKKFEASQVRVQIVANVQNTVTHVLAFMEDFGHADAMVFQVKKTDDYETQKGDNKDKRWKVKLKDAKFSLPKDAAGQEEAVRRRFVNLEGMDYAEEHDDITIGFVTEEERDRFAQALPAAATMGRGLTLKRRI